MYIKAKYPNTYRWYMKVKTQGIGSLYGGNHSSVVENNATERNLQEDRESDFPN
jgi:hypothetical protein